MLVQLFYVSTPVGPVTTTVTKMILDHSMIANKAEKITGILCQGNGLYFQVLEGPRSAINNKYKKILNDTRHQNVELLSYDHIEERHFGDWSMVLIDLSAVDAMISMNHCDFDPYIATGFDMRTMLKDLLVSKKEINQILKYLKLLLYLEKLELTKSASPEQQLLHKTRSLSTTGSFNLCV
jgi:hypothetical protein